MAKLKEVIERWEDWASGEVDDKAISVALLDDDGYVMYLVRFNEGEPEDMTLGRDLYDAYQIADMIKAAYRLGKEGKELEFESIEEEL